MTTSNRAFLFHPREPYAVLCLLLLVCVVRLWIAAEDRHETGEAVWHHGRLASITRETVRHQEQLAGILLDNCRYDVEHQCKFPREFDHADQHKPPFYMVYVDHQENCETFSSEGVPNTFLSINYADTFWSCPWGGLKHEPLATADKKETLANVVGKVLNRTLVNIADNVLFSQRQTMKNRKSFRQHTYTRDGIPWQLPIQSKNPRIRVLEVFLRSTINVLVDPEVHVVQTEEEKANFPVDARNGQLVIYPDEVVLPSGVFSFDEVLTMLKSAATQFAQERPQLADFTDLLHHVLKTKLSSSEQAPSHEALTLNELPPLPSFVQGKEMSVCLGQLYQHNVLISNYCGSSLQMASRKMKEFEFQLDFPMAQTLKWVYIVLAVAALSKLADQLGKGETKSQRAKRHFMQTMNDPLLRKGIENQAIEELGEEGAVKFMMGLEDRAKSCASENNADLEWKRQESLQEAWRQRLIYANGIRFVCFCLLIFTLGSFRWITHKQGLFASVWRLCWQLGWVHLGVYPNRRRSSQPNVPALRNLC